MWERILIALLSKLLEKFLDVTIGEVRELLKFKSDLKLSREKVKEITEIEDPYKRIEAMQRFLQ